MKIVTVTGIVTVYYFSNCCAAYNLSTFPLKTVLAGFLSHLQVINGLISTQIFQAHSGKFVILMVPVLTIPTLEVPAFRLPILC